MELKKRKQKNDLNLFLNDYYNLIVLFVLILILALSYFLFLGPKLKSTTAIMRDSIESQKKLFHEQERKLRDLAIENKIDCMIEEKSNGKDGITFRFTLKQIRDYQERRKYSGRNEALTSAEIDKIIEHMRP